MSRQQKQLDAAEFVLGKVMKHCTQRNPDAYRPLATEVWDTPDGHLMHVNRGGKILGIAHTDTVLWGKPKCTKKGIYNAPQLDDRLGVAIVLDILPVLGVTCDVLLTDSEERGASTASRFETDIQYNWIFSFDRRGTTTVLYDYEHAMPWLNVTDAAFDLDAGSFSDICAADHLGACGVNVGCGYYQEHTNSCHMRVADTLFMLKQFLAFYEQHQDQHFAWDESMKPMWGRWQDDILLPDRGKWNSKWNPKWDYYICPVCGEIWESECDSCKVCGCDDWTAY